MTPDCPLLRVARVTLELTTPLSIGSGLFDPLSDTPLVRDAHGLPMIPSSALSGILSRALAVIGVSTDLFGSLDLPSRLTVSHGHVHGSRNQVIDGRHNIARLREDPILSPLLGHSRPKRDRVRIDHKGVAEQEGKFDRDIVPMGHRFSFELRLWHRAEGDADHATWRSIGSALNLPVTRLGGATRAGLGGFRVITDGWTEVAYDMRKGPPPADLKPCLADPLPGSVSTTPKDIPLPAGWQTRVLKLSALDFWRIGQGEPLPGHLEKPADLLPLTESVVIWKTAGGSLETRLVIPASGIKGALRHRTAFHQACLRLADPAALEPEACLVALFGEAHGDATGQAGRIYLDDIYLPIPKVEARTIMAHNVIDRHTQATLNLFSEELLSGQTFEVTIWIAPDPLLTAFDEALADLAECRLGLGAGGRSGHGYFEAQPASESDDE